MCKKFTCVYIAFTFNGWKFTCVPLVLYIRLNFVLYEGRDGMIWGILAVIGGRMRGWDEWEFCVGVWFLFVYIIPYNKYLVYLRCKYRLIWQRLFMCIWQSRRIEAEGLVFQQHLCSVYRAVGWTGGRKQVLTASCRSFREWVNYN